MVRVKRFDRDELTKIDAINRDLVRRAKAGGDFVTHAELGRIHGIPQSAITRRIQRLRKNHFLTDEDVTRLNSRKLKQKRRSELPAIIGRIKPEHIDAIARACGFNESARRILSYHVDGEKGKPLGAVHVGRKVEISPWKAFRYARIIGAKIKKEERDETNKKVRKELKLAGPQCTRPFRMQLGKSHGISESRVYKLCKEVFGPDHFSKKTLFTEEDERNGIILAWYES
ncbi:MAG: hypothetical protein AB7H77_04745, partial [Bdellovibrionales bacterium]